MNLSIAPLRIFTCIWVLTLSSVGVMAQMASPEELITKATEALDKEDFKTAAETYQQFVKFYPTSTLLPEAYFKIGYANFRMGEYDQAITFLKKGIEDKKAPADIQELGLSLMPKVLSAKGFKQPEGPQRTEVLKQALAAFDDFVKKFPKSEQVETVNYGKALTSYQMGEYDQAVAALRANLSQFPTSESILDTQYMLALSLATAAQHAGGDPAAVAAKLEEPMKLLRDIITKGTDVALANDAQFQLAETLFNRAAPIEDKAKRKAMFEEAIEAYRAVKPKEATLEAQKARLENIMTRMRASAGDAAGLKRLQRLRDHEQEKMAALKERGDQTVSAQIKVGMAFFVQECWDEARVLFNQMEQFTGDDQQQKKEILFHKTLSYASQGLLDKANAGYEEFQQKFKGDPMAENLPVVMGVLYMNDAKAKDLNKAISLFKEALTLYPKNRFANDALIQQANAYLQLGDHDQALATYKQLLASNPSQEIAGATEFGIATIHRETNKQAEALAAYKTVRDKYPGTVYAEQAAFWVGNLSQPKTAVEEFTAFIAKYPNSQLLPTAMVSLATNQQNSGNNAAALATYKEVIQKFPGSKEASFSYFQEANLLAADQKAEEMVAVLKEFISKYPEDENIFFAYDSVAQSVLAAGKPLEAIAAYTEMAEKLPKNANAPQALFKAADLWRKYAFSQGRYLALNPEQRAEWDKGVSSSIKMVEKLVENYPDSPQVSLALQTLVEAQRMLLGAKLKTEADIENYFKQFAGRFSDKPQAKNKILFGLAAFVYEQDKNKALALMKSAFDTNLIYAPADLDLFGGTLIDQGQFDEAIKVYEKLGTDYPIPAELTPEKASREVQEAQATMLFGIGRALQKQGKVAEGGAKFDELKKLYSWSPKRLEADFGIASSHFEKQEYDQAGPLLIPIIRSTTATAELRANAMLLSGKIQEAKGKYDSAIDQYIKIAEFYEGVPAAAAEGLWRGGQLLEKQAQEAEKAQAQAQAK